MLSCLVHKWMQGLEAMLHFNDSKQFSVWNIEANWGSGKLKLEWMTTYDHEAIRYYVKKFGFLSWR